MEYEENDEEKDENLCAICLNDTTSYSVKTPCNHVFHVICLIRALEKKNSCPLCRRILTEEVITFSKRSSLDQRESRPSTPITTARLEPRPATVPRSSNRSRPMQRPAPRPAPRPAARPAARSAPLPAPLPAPRLHTHTPEVGRPGPTPISSPERAQTQTSNNVSNNMNDTNARNRSSSTTILTVRHRFRLRTRIIRNRIQVITHNNNTNHADDTNNANNTENLYSERTDTDSDSDSDNETTRSSSNIQNNNQPNQRFSFIYNTFGRLKSIFNIMQ